MKIVEREVKTNFNGESNAFTIKASPIAFDILSTKLYSNPEKAVIRELVCNAYEAQKSINNENTPIEIYVPKETNNHNLIIRDFGPGLSVDSIYDLYTSFFSSSKSTSNDFTGCFGLGSKTPFSCSNSFIVNSYYNGKKYSFLAHKKDGLPYVSLMKEEDTNEHTGLEIQIPTKNNGTGWENLIEEYVKYIPEIRINIVNSNKYINIDNKDKYISIPNSNTKMYYNEYSKYNNSFILKQGQNTYDLSDIIKTLLYKNSAISKAREFFSRRICHFDYVFEVPVGSVEIVPSREHLNTTDKNVDNIDIIIAKELVSILDFFKEEIKKFVEIKVDAKEIERQFALEVIEVVTDSKPKVYSDIVKEKYNVNYTPRYYDSRRFSHVTVRLADTTSLWGVDAKQVNNSLFCGNIDCDNLAFYNVKHYEYGATDKSSRTKSIFLTPNQKTVFIFINHFTPVNIKHIVYSIRNNDKDYDKYNYFLVGFKKEQEKDYDFYKEGNNYSQRNFHYALKKFEHYLGLNFPFEITTVKKYFGKIPFTKMPRAKKNVDIENGKGVRVISEYTVQKNAKYIDCGLSYNSTVGSVKNKFKSDNSIIVYSSRNNETYIDSIAKTLNRMMAVDSENTVKILKEQLNVTLNNSGQINLIEIPISNNKYFKDYATIDKDILKDIVLKSNIKIYKENTKSVFNDKMYSRAFRLLGFIQSSNKFKKFCNDKIIKELTFINKVNTLRNKSIVFSNRNDNDFKHSYQELFTKEELKNIPVFPITESMIKRYTSYDFIDITDDIRLNSYSYYYFIGDSEARIKLFNYITRR